MKGDDISTGSPKMRPPNTSCCSARLQYVSHHATTLACNALHTFLLVPLHFYVESIRGCYVHVAIRFVITPVACADVHDRDAVEMDDELSAHSRRKDEIFDVINTLSPMLEHCATSYSLVVCDSFEIQNQVWESRFLVYRFVTHTFEHVGFFCLSSLNSLISPNLHSVPSLSQLGVPWPFASIGRSITSSTPALV